MLQVANTRSSSKIQQGKLYLIDSRSKNMREILSVSPNEFGLGVTISRNDCPIYFSLITTEADIWLMTL